MPAPSWEIEFYQRDNGSCPTRDFLHTLQSDDRVRVDRLLVLLSQFGNELKRPYVDYLRDDIWELRVRVQAGQVRLLYFFFDRRRIVITNGLIKKRDAMPPAEIDRAVTMRASYYARANKGQHL